MYIIILDADENVVAVLETDGDEDTFNPEAILMSGYQMFFTYIQDCITANETGDGYVLSDVMKMELEIMDSKMNKMLN